jgi:hypothetical protein
LLSTVYLAWGGGAAASSALYAESLARQGIVAEQMLVTPVPLNTLLWRVVAMSASYHEGFIPCSMSSPPHFDQSDRGQSLAGELQNPDSVVSPPSAMVSASWSKPARSSLRSAYKSRLYAFRFVTVAERHSPVTLTGSKSERTTLARVCPARRRMLVTLPPPHADRQPPVQADGDPSD